MNKNLLIIIMINLCMPLFSKNICGEKILFNGNIFVEATRSIENKAISIKDKRINHIGEQDEFKMSKVEKVDLKKGYVFPGFVDAHAHLKGVGYRQLKLDLSNTSSKEEMLQRVKVYNDKNQKMQIIFGEGWIEKNWSDKTFPTRFDLDEINSDIPIILERADGHAFLVNSKALTLSNIDLVTKNPSGGEIERLSDGRANGILIDTAKNLVQQLIPAQTIEDEKNAFALGAKIYQQRGWTGMHDADSLLVEKIRIFENLDLDLKIHFSLNQEDYEHCIKGRRSIKIYADGAIGSRGAALFENYEDKDSKGLIIYDQNEVRQLLKNLYERDCQIQIHAIGDRGNSMTLDLYEEFLEGTNKDLRWRIEHAQNVTEKDQQRFKKYNVIASMQPSHAIGDLHFAKDRLGLERLDYAYAWKSFIEKGVVIVGGSDAPVEFGDPLQEYYAAVTRKDLTGFHDEGWNLQQALSREEALDIFTKWPAYAIFQEEDLGTIEVGKYADFSVFDKNILTIDNMDILDTKVVMTIINGEVVYTHE